MINVIIAVLIVSFCLINVSCSTISVLVDYDRQTDFSKYTTYKYVKQKGTEQTSKFQNDLNRKRFALAIEKELSEKGFRREADVKPDFKVVYHIRLQKKLDISTYGYRYYPGLGIGERYIQTKVYQEGSVIIDIIDTNENQLVWRGSAEGVLNEHADADNIVNNVVKQILKRFPPRSNKKI